MASLETRLKAFLKKYDRFKRHPIKEIPQAEYNCAEFLARTMSLVSKEDYLLFFSSLVLMSAKNKNIKMGRKHQVGSISDESQRYSFKELVAKGIDAAIANNVNFLKFDMQFDSKGEKIVYVKLHGVQFSFHGVPFTPKMRFARTAEKQQYEAQVWDHTPLQNGASELFNYAIEQDNLTRIYYDGSGANPRDLLTRERRKIRKQEAIKNAVVSTANNNELMRLEDAFEDGNASEIKTVSVSEVQTATKQTTKNNDNINEFAN